VKRQVSVERKSSARRQSSREVKASETQDV
jgi:hypothetical protein